MGQEQRAGQVKSRSFQSQLQSYTFQKGRCRMDIGEFICDKVWELAPLNCAPDDIVAEAEEEEAG